MNGPRRSSFSCIKQQIASNNHLEGVSFGQGPLFLAVVLLGSNLHPTSADKAGDNGPPFPLSYSFIPLWSRYMFAYARNRGGGPQGWTQIRRKQKSVLFLSVYSMYLTFNPMPELTLIPLHSWLQLP